LLSATIAFLHLAVFFAALYNYLTGRFVPIERVKSHAITGITMIPSVQVRLMEATHQGS